MSRRVARISWRKGQPLSLSISQAKGFLDLPRELRDKIYYHSLVISEPIVVWSGRRQGYDDERRDPSGTMTFTTPRTIQPKSAVIDHLALSLLLCNRQVSREAAYILYFHNTFRFMGDRPWGPLYAFLQMIGANSRDALRNLEVQVRQDRVWQDANGEYVFPCAWYDQNVIPRSAYSRRELSPTAEDFVEYIDPAIEACFRRIGKRRPPFSLVLLLDMDLLPGLRMYHDQQHRESGLMSLDLPIMIENCRQELTADPGVSSQVEILWKGECLRDYFTSQIKLIGDKGWEILEAKEKVIPHHEYPKYTMLFTIRGSEGLMTSSIPDAC